MKHNWFSVYTSPEVTVIRINPVYYVIRVFPDGLTLKTTPI